MFIELPIFVGDREFHTDKHFVWMSIAVDAIASFAVAGVCPHLANYAPEWCVVAERDATIHYVACSYPELKHLIRNGLGRVVANLDPDDFITLSKHCPQGTCNHKGVAFETAD